MQVVRWTSPAGKRRLLTVFDPEEARRYQRLTEVALRSRRPWPSSFGCDRPPGRPWQERRTGWLRTVRAAASAADEVIASDVVDCYVSIGPRAIRMAASWAGGDPEPLLSFLATVHQAGAGGLPIGPAPSAAIADAVLAIADACVRAEGITPIRWVDDVLFAGGRSQVARAERAWRGAIRDLGLRDHDGKRRAVGRSARWDPSFAGPPAHVIMRSS